MPYLAWAECERHLAAITQVAPEKVSSVEMHPGHPRPDQSQRLDTGRDRATNGAGVQSRPVSSR
jgi:hypothetical protein